MKLGLRGIAREALLNLRAHVGEWFAETRELVRGDRRVEEVAAADRATLERMFEEVKAAHVTRARSCPDQGVREEVERNERINVAARPRGWS
jgi:hypothetical protein